MKIFVAGQSRRAERGHSCPQQLPNYGAPSICWRSCALHIAADRNVRAPPRFHWGVTNALNFQLTKLRAYVVLSRNSRRRAMYDANQKGSACPFAFSAFRFSLLLCLALLGGSMFSGCATTSDNHRGTESSAEQQPGLSCWEKLGAYLCWTAQEMTYGFFSSNGGGVVGK